MRQDLGVNGSAEIPTKLTHGRMAGAKIPNYSSQIAAQIIPQNNYEPTKFDFVSRQIISHMVVIVALESRHVSALSGTKPGGGTIFVQFQSDPATWRPNTVSQLEPTRRNCR